MVGRIGIWSHRNTYLKRCLYKVKIRDGQFLATALHTTDVLISASVPCLNVILGITCRRL